MKMLFWPEKGLCLGFYWGLLLWGGGGIVDDDDEKTYAHEAGGDCSVPHPFSEECSSF